MEERRYRMSIVCLSFKRGSLPQVTRINITATGEILARRRAIHQAMASGWSIMQFVTIEYESLI